jgi:hypothetical protein
MKLLVYQAKPRKKLEFVSKSLLEGYGVEFPVGPRTKDSISRSTCNALNYSRDYSHLIPENGPKKNKSAYVLENVYVKVPLCQRPLPLVLLVP